MTLFREHVSDFHVWSPKIDFGRGITLLRDINFIGEPRIARAWESDAWMHWETGTYPTDYDIKALLKSEVCIDYKCNSENIKEGLNLLIFVVSLLAEFPKNSFTFGLTSQMNPIAAASLENRTSVRGSAVIFPGVEREAAWLDQEAEKRVQLAFSSIVEISKGDGAEYWLPIIFMLIRCCAYIPEIRERTSRLSMCNAGIGGIPDFSGRLALFYKLLEAFLAPIEGPDKWESARNKWNEKNARKILKEEVGIIRHSRDWHLHFNASDHKRMQKTSAEKALGLSGENGDVYRYFLKEAPVMLREMFASFLRKASGQNT